MSTGGNVPTQGAAGMVAEANANQKKRGDRGKLGKGTAGSRLKSAFNKWNSVQGAPKNMVSLKEFARLAASGKDTGPGRGIATKEELQADAKSWMERKGLS